MHVRRHHFKLARAVAAVFFLFRRLFDNGCKISLLWLFGSAPNSAVKNSPFIHVPSRKPGSPTFLRGNTNRGQILSPESEGGEEARLGGGGIKACVHACEPECIELSSVEKFCEWPRVCWSLSVHLCVCVCCAMCLQCVASPHSREIPGRYEATVICETFVLHKGQPASRSPL